MTLSGDLARESDASKVVGLSLVWWLGLLFIISGAGNWQPSSSLATTRYENPDVIIHDVKQKSIVTSPAVIQ